MPLMHVNAAALNIRATAGMTADNVVATLPFGHEVNTTGEHDLKRWIPVEATLNGKTHKGFVNVGYLRAPLSAAKEALLAVAAKAWMTKDTAYRLPTSTTGFADEPVKAAKPTTGDLVNGDLVVARGMTQVWALNAALQIVKYPLLEDGRLDDPHGKVKLVYRNLA